ncbi:MAG: hypothetical protein HEQ32_04145 [Vampirovibrio sp.]
MNVGGILTDKTFTKFVDNGIKGLREAELNLSFNWAIREKGLGPYSPQLEEVSQGKFNGKSVIMMTYERIKGKNLNQLYTGGLLSYKEIHDIQKHHLAPLLYNMYQKTGYLLADRNPGNLMLHHELIEALTKKLGAKWGDKRLTEKERQEIINETIRTAIREVENRTKNTKSTSNLKAPFIPIDIAPFCVLSLSKKTIGETFLDPAFGKRWGFEVSDSERKALEASRHIIWDTLSMNTPADKKKEIKDEHIRRFQEPQEITDAIIKRFIASHLKSEYYNELLPWRSILVYLKENIPIVRPLIAYWAKRVA